MGVLDPAGRDIRRRRPRRGPVSVPRPEVSVRAPRRAPSRAPSKPVGVFARPIGRNPTPGSRTLQRVSQRVTRTQRKLPPKPAPVVPTIKNPTHAEHRAILHATAPVVREVTRAANDRAVAWLRQSYRNIPVGQRTSAFARKLREEIHAELANQGAKVAHVYRIGARAQRREQDLRARTYAALQGYPVAAPGQRVGVFAPGRGLTISSLPAPLTGREAHEVYNERRGPLTQTIEPIFHAPDRRNVVEKALSVAAIPGQKVSQRFAEQLASSGATGLGGRGLQDVLDVFAQAPASIGYLGYAGTSAGLHAASGGRVGSTAPLGAAYKSFEATDPGFAYLRAPFRKGGFHKARQLASAHPGVLAMEVIPALNAADRVAGFATRITREGTIGRMPFRVAPPARRPVREVPGTPLREIRLEPKGLIASRVIRHVDRKDARKAATFRAQARAAYDRGAKEEGDRLSAKAQHVDPTRMPETRIKGRVNDFQDLAEGRRRHNAAVVDHQLAESLTGLERHHYPIVRLIAEQIAGEHIGPAGHVSLLEDLRSLRQEAINAGEHLKFDKRQQNRRGVAAIDKVISDLEKGKVDPAKLQAAGREYSKIVGTPEARLLDRQILGTDSAKFVPFGVRRMGLRFDNTRIRTPEYQAHLERKAEAQRAAGDVRGAQRTLETARRQSARQSVRTSQHYERAVREVMARDKLFVAARRNHAALGRQLASARRRGEDVTGLLAQRRSSATRLKTLEQRARDNAERVVTRADRTQAPPSGIGQVHRSLEKFEKVSAEESFARNNLREAQARLAVTKQAAGHFEGDRFLGPGFAGPRAQLALERASELRTTARDHRNEAQAAREAGDSTAYDAARQRALRAERQAEDLRAQIAYYPDARVSTAEIKGVMESMGLSPEETAFITQQPGVEGARNYFMDWSRPRGIGGPRRTGEATRELTMNMGEDALRENARRMQSLVDADHNWITFLDEFAVKDGNGRMWTRGERRDVENRLRAMNGIPGGHEYSAVRVNPWLGRHEALMKMLEETSSEHLAASEGDVAGAGGVEHPLKQSILEALHDFDNPNATAGEGEWAIIPKAAADHLAAHLKVLNPGTGLKALRLFNNFFRRTVLATSPPWLTGNIVEGLLRLGIERAGPLSYLHMKHTLQALDRIALDESVPMRTRLDAAQARIDIHERAFSGGQAGLVKRGKVFTSADQFKDSNRYVAELARGMATLRRTPGPKQLGDFWAKYTDWVFNSVNSSIEGRMQMALGGKYLKRAELLSPEGARLMGRSAEQAARGLTQTEEQVALAHYVRRAWGQYSAFGPGGRQLIALYTPFIAWTLNALKFLFDVLPRDHPALEAALAASYSASKDWRESQGLAKYIDGALPGFLQGSIPTSHGPLRIGRYTPFSIATDLGQNLSSVVLPQYHGALAALSGLDWKGQKLKDANGNDLPDTKRIGLAIKELLFASVPVANQVSRFIQYGGSFDPRDWDPTTLAALRRVVNPFEPVHRTDTQLGGGVSVDGGNVDWGTGALNQGPSVDWGNGVRTPHEPAGKGPSTGVIQW